jgi:hypothetical protein
MWSLSLLLVYFRMWNRLPDSDNKYFNVCNQNLCDFGWAAIIGTTSGMQNSYSELIRKSKAIVRDAHL